MMLRVCAYDWMPRGVVALVPADGDPRKMVLITDIGDSPMIDTGRLTAEQTVELFGQLLNEMDTETVAAQLEAHLDPEVKRTLGETWFDIDEDALVHAAPKPMRLRFEIIEFGDRSAGISSYEESISVLVDSGDPGGAPGEFANELRAFLKEWYDGASVECVSSKK